MAQRWQMICDRFDGLTLRERGLVLLSVLASVFLLCATVIGKPLAEARQRVDLQTQALNQRISQMALEEAAYQQAAAVDPEVSLRRERDDLKARLATLDRELAELSLGLVSAHQLATVLQEVLVRADKLQLRSLQTLPVEPLNLASTAGDERAHVYKHSVALVVSGTYFDVLDYLKTLEALGWRFYWEELRYEQEQYPNGLFELRVFTLSTEKGLLGV